MQYIIHVCALSLKNIRFKTREMREFQTFMFQSTDSLCSDTFQPKIFRLKTREMREFQTFMFQPTDSLCSDTFQPKIFTSKLKRIA
jgi:hypothetical protein